MKLMRNFYEYELLGDPAVKSKGSIPRAHDGH